MVSFIYRTSYTFQRFCFTQNIFSPTFSVVFHDFPHHFPPDFPGILDVARGAVARRGARCQRHLRDSACLPERRGRAAWKHWVVALDGGNWHSHGGTPIAGVYFMNKNHLELDDLEVPPV